MEQAEAGVEDVHQDAAGGLRLLLPAATGPLVQPSFGNLNVPVGVLIPEEFVNFAAGGAQLIFLNVVRDASNQLVAFRYNVLLREGKLRPKAKAAKLDLSKDVMGQLGNMDFSAMSEEERAALMENGLQMF